MEHETSPLIGMIVPPLAGQVPPEAVQLYPRGVRFAARGLGLAELTIEGYSNVIDRVISLALELRDEEGASAISLMGTSLSFFRGPEFNTTLIELLQQETGLPATTMSTSISDALHELGARRVAVGTAYSDIVNDRLSTYLKASGFHVVSMTGMDLTAVEDIHAVTPAQVSDLARQAADLARNDAPDAIFVSCGGLPALHLAGEIEPELGLPVVASSTAGVWGAMRCAGLPETAPALGRLGQMPSHPTPRAAS